MQRAKMYMDKLAQGVDPITNQTIPEDSVLNNVRLARCFFYVSGVSEQVINNGGTVGQRVKTLNFSITPEQCARVKIMDYPVRITGFVDAVYAAVENGDMKKPNLRKITDWLLSVGFLTQVTGADGKVQRVPTEQGMRMGMRTEKRQTKDGEYLAVLYDSHMQRWLLQNLGEILREK